MPEATVLVTGGNSGIGFVVSRELARSGASLVMLCRSEEKARRAQESIVRDVPGAQVELLIADLACRQSIREAAEAYSRRFSRLDVLVNNAGALHSRKELTPDGIELTFAANHLGPFLLTRLLEPVLRKTPGARVVNVSSELHRQSRLRLDEVSDPPRYDPWTAYSDSKLCNVLFTYGLAARVPGDVTVNCLHPGVVATGFARQATDIRSLALRASRWLLKRPEDGARCALRLARSPEVAGVSGQYFDEDGREAPSSPLSRDQGLIQGLWKLSEEMTGLSA